ncbi:MAG: S41 family peptidase [Bacteroidetes bacterium]|nr:S41 family peptidase [Bacteroidota bacterium]
MDNKVVKSLIVIVVLLSLFMLYERFYGNGSLFATGEKDKIDQAYDLIKKLYVDELSDSTLGRNAIEGILSKLDPHSVYLTDDEVRGSEEEMKGEFEGIGIEFQLIKDTINVISVMPGGPSEKAGLLPGDKIIKIGDSSAVKIKTDLIRKRIKGKAGSTVNISILRYGKKDLIVKSIRRGKIPVKSVTAGFMLDSITGYFNIVRFGEKTSVEVLDMLNSLRAKGMKQIVIDLRNNPGGYLNEAVKIADYFIDGEKVIVSTKGRISQANEVFKAETAFPFEKMPLILLINRSSASAAEILAGAIQDWDRGLIIGERSFGKGLVQQQVPLGDGSAIRLTIAKYYTPLGRSIQRHYEDREDYYKEVEEREDSENESLSDSVNHLPSYLTPDKRKVYGGGGITPDVAAGVFEDKKEAYALLRNNFYSQAALLWFEKNGDRIKNEFKDVSGFESKFEFSQGDINSFLAFAGEINLESDIKNSPASISYMKNRIKAEVARYIWNQQGFYFVYMKHDDVVLKALKLFPEAAKIAKLR